MSKLYINNDIVEYIKFGKGKKNLIMIQGLNTRSIKGSKLMLSLMYRIFKKDYTVYLFDRKTNINEDITVKDFANDIACYMDALNIKKADVFGVSEGGMIAQNLAILRPDLVNKLVLAVTLSKNNETVINTINNWINLTKENKMKDLIIDMAYKMYSSEYVKRYKLFFPLLTYLQKPKDINRFINLCKSCLTCDTYNKLDQIKCPVFVIGGKKDLIVTIDASLEIIDKLNCEYYIYDDLGHALYEEAKDFNKRVYEFLSK